MASLLPAGVQPAWVLFHRVNGTWQYVNLGSGWDCVAEDGVPPEAAAMFPTCYRAKTVVPAPYVGMPCTEKGRVAPGEQGEITCTLVETAGTMEWRPYSRQGLQPVERGARCTAPTGGTAFGISTDNYYVWCDGTGYNPNTVWELIKP